MGIVVPVVAVLPGVVTVVSGAMFNSNVVVVKVVIVYKVQFYVATKAENAVLVVVTADILGRVGFSNSRGITAALPYKCTHLYASELDFNWISTS